MFRTIIIALAISPLLWACDGAFDPAASGAVAVRFQTVQSASAAAVAEGEVRPSFNHTAGGNQITITGDNGTLVIADIRFIVAELELERADGDCGAVVSDSCAELEAGPFLVQLLDGAPADVVNAMIPAGSYVEFEFEVENLEDDDQDSDDKRAARDAILTAIRQDYPAFPTRGSMVVHGTFNDTPFTVYFDAEIEIEREFSTPFRVPEDGAIAVQLDPEAWFRVGSRVLDLSAFDGQTVEFEMEFEQGVASVESDD